MRRIIFIFVLFLTSLFIAYNLQINSRINFSSGGVTTFEGQCNASFTSGFPLTYYQVNQGIFDDAGDRCMTVKINMRDIDLPFFIADVSIIVFLIFSILGIGALFFKRISFELSIKRLILSTLLGAAWGIGSLVIGLGVAFSYPPLVAIWVLSLTVFLPYTIGSYLGRFILEPFGILGSRDLISLVIFPILTTIIFVYFLVGVIQKIRAANQKKI